MRNILSGGTTFCSPSTQSSNVTSFLGGSTTLSSSSAQPSNDPDLTHVKPIEIAPIEGYEEPARIKVKEENPAPKRFDKNNPIMINLIEEEQNNLYQKQEPEPLNIAPREMQESFDSDATVAYEEGVTAGAVR